MKTFRLMGFIVVVAILGLSCSKSGREITSEQLQKRRDNLYYAVNEEKPYSGKVVKLYKSGQKRTERTFKNGKLHGLSSEWNFDGQKKAEVSYQNGVQSGPYRTWYDNGQQEKEGAYKDGKEDGKWTEWYKNGKMKFEAEYKDGELNGKYIKWYENGQKYIEKEYKNGKEDGKWTKWYENGQKKFEAEYKDGKLHGKLATWFENGEQEKELGYENGKLVFEKGIMIGRINHLFDTKKYNDAREAYINYLREYPETKYKNEIEKKIELCKSKILVDPPIADGEWRIYDDDLVCVGSGKGKYLMWPRNKNGPGCNYGKTLTWNKAISWANNLVYKGYSDWRVPTCDELSQLYKHRSFISYEKCYYWSSYPKEGWHRCIAFGRIGWGGRGGEEVRGYGEKDQKNIRAVRNGH